MQESLTSPYRHTYRQQWQWSVCPKLRRSRCLGESLPRYGILDSYRQERNPASSQDLSQQHKPMPKRTRHPRGMTQTSSDSEADDELCTPECVKEIHTVKEFEDVVQNENPKSLIVVDFYKTACGSCRYIQPGFVKLCRSSQEEHAPVIFLKHNVIDEYDEATELGNLLKVRNVPLFQFYKDNCLVEQFATREKIRIGKAINQHVGWEVCHI